MKAAFWPCVLVAILGLCVPLRAQAEAEAETTALGYPIAPLGYPTGATPYGVTISTREAARLRALDADLHLLAARSDGRYLDGSLSLVVGGAFITLGALIHDPLFRTLLLLTGGVAASRGMIELTVLPNAEAAAAQFSRMPMASPGQVIARLAYGEESLARLAHQTRRARLIDGSVTLLAGAAYLPVYTLLRHLDDRNWRYGDDVTDYVVIAFSAVSLGAAVITLVVKSDAERTLAAYGRLRDRLAEEERTRSARRWPGVSPYASRDGAGLAAVLRF